MGTETMSLVGRVAGEAAEASTNVTHSQSQIGERQSEGLNFAKWDEATLNKYRQYFKLPKGTSQQKLAQIVAKHFASQHLDTRNDEAEIVHDFLDEVLDQQKEFNQSQSDARAV